MQIIYFFPGLYYEQRRSRSTINFAMHKIKTGTLTAGPVKSNFKGTIQRFVASDNVFSFMSSVKGTPAHWKQFLYDVLVMVKQLGIPTYFLTLSCADLRWVELSYTINRLNNPGLGEEKLKNLSYQERCNLLNNNPVHAPNIQNEADCIDFNDTAINAWLPNHVNDSELFELVKTYQVHVLSRTCWKYIKNECRFSYG